MDWLGTGQYIYYQPFNHSYRNRGKIWLAVLCTTVKIRISYNFLQITLVLSLLLSVSFKPIFVVVAFIINMQALSAVFYYHRRVCVFIILHTVQTLWIFQSVWETLWIFQSAWFDKISPLYLLPSITCNFFGEKTNWRSHRVREKLWFQILLYIMNVPSTRYLVSACTNNVN